EPHRELARDRARAGRRFRPLRARDRRRDRGMTAALPAIAGVPIDFILFAAVLAGVALFHHHTLRVALIGLVVITAYKVAFAPFHGIAGIAGFGTLLGHEAVTLLNLLGLLLGFALLSKHFEESGIPSILPRFLPDDWKGG